MTTLSDENDEMTERYGSEENYDSKENHESDESYENEENHDSKENLISVENSEQYEIQEGSGELQETNGNTRFRKKGRRNATRQIKNNQV